MHKEDELLIGPFKQILPMSGLPLKGALKDEQLIIISDGGILIKEGKIVAIDKYSTLAKTHPNASFSHISEDMVALPGFIDAHTHICFGGTRAFDYAARNNGKTYLEIAKEGGGIWSTVTQTRAAAQSELTALMMTRIDRQIRNGITTVEVKSGYGLNVEQELKMLRAIEEANKQTKIDLISTCLAAHILPKDIDLDEAGYLNMILKELVPIIQKEKLTNRFDIFIEESAFGMALSTPYLNTLKKMGFDLTVHGDQFSPGGSHVAIDVGAKSVDHLEASGEKEILALAHSEVIPVALPGATIGLGCPFTPARKLLDAGTSLAIASDWNPGSAPQGNLLSQAAIMGTFEKLSAAEILSGITYRAAAALGLKDKGILAPNKNADIVGFAIHDYREILYHQGELKPKFVWKNGEQIYKSAY